MSTGGTSTISSNSKLVDLSHLLDRIVVKTSNGIVIQDTNSAHVMSRLLDLMFTEPHAKTNEGGYSGGNMVNAKGSVGAF